MIFQFDGFAADPGTLEVRRDGQALELEPKAVRTLFHLIRNRERLVTKEELIAEVWEGVAVTDNAITRVISQLRKQLGDNARNPRYIETNQTNGYRFIAPVVEADPATPKPRRRALLLASAAAAGAALLWRITRPAAPRLTNLRQLTSSVAADLWPSFSPDSSQLVYSSNRSNTFELYIRSRAPGSADRQLTTDQQENIQPAWSPDGQTIAYVSRRHGGIFVIPVSGGAPRQITDSGDSPAWSPDGRTLAYRRLSLNINPVIETTGLPDSTIWTTPLTGAPPAPLTDPGAPDGGHGYPRWSPDGKRVLFTSTKGQAYTVDAATRAVTPIDLHGTPVRSSVFGPDGASRFFLSSTGLWRAQPPELLLPSGAASSRDLTVSNDGKCIAFSQQIGDSAIWSIPVKPDGSPAGDPQPLIRDRSLRNTTPVFSADGSFIAYASIRQGGEMTVMYARSGGASPAALTPPNRSASRPVWFGREQAVCYRVAGPAGWEYWVHPLNGPSRRLPLKMDLANADRLRFSPDGARLAAHLPAKAGYQLIVEDLATHTIRALTPPDRNIGFPAWSPDGSQLAAEERHGGKSAIVSLPAKGGEIKTLPTEMAQSFVFDWSPDGTKILFAGLRENVWDIYWIAVATGQVQQLTHFTSHSAFVRYPSWSPSGGQIVFEHSDLTANIYLADLQ